MLKRRREAISPADELRLQTMTVGLSTQFVTVMYGKCRKEDLPMRGEGWGNLVRLYFAPVVLVVIASVQFYLAQTHGLSPWKGGGFGMFSTVDSPGERFLRVYLITDDGEIPVMVPDHLRGEEFFVRTLPLRRSVEQLAVEIASETWIRTDVAVSSGTGAPFTPAPPPGTFLPPVRYQFAFEPDPPPEAVVEANAVRVAVWQLSFDPGTLQLSAIKLIEATTLDD